MASGHADPKMKLGGHNIYVRSVSEDQKVEGADRKHIATLLWKNDVVPVGWHVEVCAGYEKKVSDFFSRCLIRVPQSAAPGDQNGELRWLQSIVKEGEYFVSCSSQDPALVQKILDINHYNQREHSAVDDGVFVMEEYQPPSSIVCFSIAPRQVSSAPSLPHSRSAPLNAEALSASRYPVPPLSLNRLSVGSVTEPAAPRVIHGFSVPRRGGSFDSSCPPTPMPPVTSPAAQFPGSAPVRSALSRLLDEAGKGVSGQPPR